MATIANGRPPASRLQSSKASQPLTTRRKKNERTDIWTSLLRQTREAQARSRAQTLQSRNLILCGGTPEDQRNFTEHYVARPPPAQLQGRNQRRDGRAGERGEVKLSNRFAYGYGHVTLFSPPQQGSAGLLGGEAEEVARVEVHTVPEPEGGYEATLRRLLIPRKDKEEHAPDANDLIGESEGESQGRRASVCILMSWREPWTFLDRLRRWLSLLARALLPEAARKDEPPLEILKEHQVKIAVVLQHVEVQETLLRDPAYSEESFDYISQSIRTCLLPTSAALVHTASSPPPQQPGLPLSDIQKVLYTALDLDIAALQPRTSAGVGSSGTSGKKDDMLLPKHNVVDRMAIVVPSGWDSLGKIRLLSETFSPEAVMEGWTSDLAMSIFATSQPASLGEDELTAASTSVSPTDGQQIVGAEVFESTISVQPSPMPSPPLSPSKAPKSALRSYAEQIVDPNAHKAPRPPQIEVATKPEQEFLAEMKAALMQYEAQDQERQRKDGGLDVSTTHGALSATTGAASGGGSGGALSELGDVSFNVGGVNYNTASAEAAIGRLKRPQTGSSGLESSSPRTSTPRPPRREGRDTTSGSVETPSTSSKGGDIPTDKLEEYFASLMKRSGGDRSASSTPSKS